MDSTQNIISFCTGYGGIELGLRRISPDFRTVAYVEIEAFACTNLVAKIEQGKLDAAPIWTNLKTFDGKPFRGKVHGIIGGYPCQPFSNAGQRKGTEDPRHLWPYIEQHIRTIRPVWSFFENVGGHLTLGFEEVFKSLRDMGYKVEAGLFTAAEVGAPHKRERLFILAHSESQRDTTRHERVSIKTGDRGQNKLLNNGSQESRVFSEGELANPERFGRRGRDNGELGGQGRSIQIEGSGELADTEQQRPVQPEFASRHRQGVSQNGSARQRTGEELADTSRERRQAGLSEQGQRQKGQSEIADYDCDRWPARPGQEQYEWEEPRTVESGMGRTVDGFASRVDELRLLGNGVVPQTAELAFRTLWEQICQE